MFKKLWWSPFCSILKPIQYPSNLQPFDRIPPTILSTTTRYENMMSMFGKKGYFCTTIPEFQEAVKECMTVRDAPTIINVIISPTADRKPQTFNWLTESKL